MPNESADAPTILQKAVSIGKYTQLSRMNVLTDDDMDLSWLESVRLNVADNRPETRRFGFDFR